jgi:hypothetical protein
MRDAKPVGGLDLVLSPKMMLSSSAPSMFHEEVGNQFSS